jgi:hypothetical protein
VKPPCPIEEQTLVCFDRLTAIQHIVESRYLCARWMRTLDRLLQLTRVAQENEALSALADGEHVGE